MSAEIPSARISTSLSAEISEESFRFGGAMNKNPHAHAAVTDGLFVPADPDDPDSPLLFVPLPPPTDFDIEALLRAVCRRVLHIARRFHVNELTLRALERELGLRPRPGNEGTDESLDDARR